MDNIQKAYIEIRGATGGDEAKLWGLDLLRMYMRYALKKGWKTTAVDEKTVLVTGYQVFDLFKNESGVHRVQRIPITEKRGRIHTSTATVAVLPEIKETEIHINPVDLEWQFYRASTQGGQNVQKVSTAVRLIHKPSGIVVTAQEERFQEQNRKIAMDLLRAKLWEKEEERKMAEIADYRSPIGRGMRAEKIRTYNFPQNRVTDHRIGKNWGNLEAIVDGNLDKVIEATKNL
ncbi:MAG: Peptide chain release factor 1 [Microgenomates group bacterium GW2011_GWC1_37_8]|uniref:Peptide chain release factor 1 n=1 Tax=Candidatus Woesebacteria bacterium GW2011_GWB1_38_8 TaxID=1618570 RepID=A0A0G0L1T8_9BACT|nr:MAG: Peptide chain release factor 1 [Microgenomates group bacterium GW2011_GWC1_37_8]KKQ85943.1 MAG: Peptide chain release factor 1 [Candidatus Woesebacteria bacterium GW2011_GWB1_38_8]